MDAAQFEQVFDEQIKICSETLIEKAKEYASDTDRLHNFKISAALQGETQHQALAGMMSKHTVSIYDMIKSGKQYSMDVWNEKIKDHINFLILLKAIVCEEDMIEAQRGSHAQEDNRL